MAAAPSLRGVSSTPPLEQPLTGTRSIPGEKILKVKLNTQRKRKRTPCTTNAPEVGIVQPSSGGNHNRTPNPSNAMEVDGTDTNGKSKVGASRVTSEVEHQPNVVDVEGASRVTSEVEAEIGQSNQECDDDWEGEEADDDWEGEDIGHDWYSDEYERTGCVEGQIEPEMVENFLHGEENRTFRSKVWDEFSKFRVAGVVTKGQCIHCNAEITARRGVGTSAMGTHLKRCKVRKSVTNVARQLKSVVMSPEGVALEKWRFSQDVSRRELVRMISLHGFPLAMVNYDGFRRFVSSLNLVFKMISRRTISTDCLKRFEEQKQSLQDVFRSTKSRISLTMDMWTSNQTLGYMCITSHFIDDDWKMQKRIIKFSFLKTPHTGVLMFNAILKSIQEWGIEHKLFAVTLDNARNNNTMINLLRGNLLERKLLFGEGMLLHCRCAGHIINLACKAGFVIINPIVHKVRESVKFLEGSPSRKQKFEEIIQQLGITYQKRPNIDTSTRWNSTYIMLETCLQLKRAFDSLKQQEPNYTYAPSSEEWEKAQKVCGLLKTFYDATMVISGSLYPTSNLYFHEIWEVKIALENGILEQDVELIETIKFMQAKFKKYWKLTWLQISFPVIFDPRFKLAFIDFRLRQAFGNKANSKIDTVKKVLLGLFKDYSNMSLGYQETIQVGDVQHGSGRYADWDTHMRSSACSTSEVPSELETYLKKQPIPRSENFDILAWWKSNASEYPTISRMAQDILSVQASTVASESAFSMGRRIISDFRSRLTPNTVEALICLQDWIRASGSTQFSMEAIDCFSDQHAESMEQATCVLPGM